MSIINDLSQGNILIKNNIMTEEKYKKEKKDKRAKKTDNCQVLKNLAYKTMLLNEFYHIKVDAKKYDE